MSLSQIKRTVAARAKVAKLEDSDDGFESQSFGEDDEDELDTEGNELSYWLQTHVLDR